VLHAGPESSHIAFTFGGTMLMIPAVMYVFPMDFNARLCDYFLSYFPWERDKRTNRLFEFGFYLTRKGYSEVLLPIGLEILQTVVHRDGFRELASFLSGVARGIDNPWVLVERLIDLSQCELRCSGARLTFRILKIIVPCLFLANAPLPSKPIINLISSLITSSAPLQNPNNLDERLEIAMMSQFVGQFGATCPEIAKLTPIVVNRILMFAQKVTEMQDCKKSLCSYGMQHWELVLSDFGIEAMLIDDETFLAMITQQRP
jgi:hypothetical protein